MNVKVGDLGLAAKL